MGLLSTYVHIDTARVSDAIQNSQLRTQKAIDRQTAQQAEAAELAGVAATAHLRDVRVSFLRVCVFTDRGVLEISEFGEKQGSDRRSWDRLLQEHLHNPTPVIFSVHVLQTVTLNDSHLGLLRYEVDMFTGEPTQAPRALCGFSIGRDRHVGADADDLARHYRSHHAAYLLGGELKLCGAR